MLDSVSRQRMVKAGNCWRMRLIAINARLFNGLPLSRDHLVFVYVYNNYISIHVGDCYVLVNSDVITTCPVEDHLILVMKTSDWFRCQTVLFYLLCTSSM